MAFSEAVKLEAKQRANFRCVVCHQCWVEVHHIAPQSEDGPDTIDNAAPLCGSCHSQYGGNPDLRKQLREMRDWWWRRCAQTHQQIVDGGIGERLDALQVSLLQGQKRQEDALVEIKDIFTAHFRDAEERVLASGTVADVLSVSSSVSTGLPPLQTRYCFSCRSDYPASYDACPRCAGSGST